MSSNEKLAVRIQGGERDLLPLLWDQVERFVRLQAIRRAPSGAVDQEDLYQSGYLAMVAAVETFDPGRGMSFIGWMVPHLKTAFNEAMGTRSNRQRLDPIHKAVSLEMPLGEDGDDTLGDMVADSENGFLEAENKLWREALRAELARALNGLPEGDTLRRRYFQGQTLDSIAATEGTSRENIRQREVQGLRKLRRPCYTRSLQEFLTPYYLHVSVSRFNTTGTSAVEEIAMRREKYGLTI